MLEDQSPPQPPKQRRSPQKGHRQQHPGGFKRPFPYFNKRSFGGGFKARHRQNQQEQGDREISTKKATQPRGHYMRDRNTQRYHTSLSGKTLIMPIANPTGITFDGRIKMPESMDKIKTLTIKHKVSAIAPPARAYYEILKKVVASSEEEDEDDEEMNDDPEEAQNERGRLLICDRFEKIQDARRALHPNLFAAAQNLLKSHATRQALGTRQVTYRKFAGRAQKKLKTLRLNGNKSGKIFK